METVLVVDDEPTVVKLCRRILELGGYTVVTAATGSDALQVLKDKTNQIDLALLDVMMPGMNGIELAKRIEGMRPNTRIVLMSGFTPRDVERVEGKDNPYCVIWKPFEADSLVRMIRNAISRKA